MDDTHEPEVEFARNKTIIMLGDSVDRGCAPRSTGHGAMARELTRDAYANRHIVDFCEFAHGSLMSIMPDHELSPAYPPGLERPPSGSAYLSFFRVG